MQFLVIFSYKKKELTKGPEGTSPLDKHVISQCTKIGENGETIMISVSTEESHEATITGMHAIHTSSFYENARISYIIQNFVLNIIHNRLEADQVQ